MGIKIQEKQRVEIFYTEESRHSRDMKVLLLVSRGYSLKQTNYLSEDSEFELCDILETHVD